MDTTLDQVNSNMIRSSNIEDKSKTAKPPDEVNLLFPRPKQLTLRTPQLTSDKNFTILQHLQSNFNFLFSTLLIFDQLYITLLSIPIQSGMQNNILRARDILFITNELKYMSLLVAHYRTTTYANAFYKDTVRDLDFLHQSINNILSSKVYCSYLSFSGIPSLTISSEFVLYILDPLRVIVNCLKVRQQIILNQIGEIYVKYLSEDELDRLDLQSKNVIPAQEADHVVPSTVGDQKVKQIINKMIMSKKMNQNSKYDERNSHIQVSRMEQMLNASSGVTGPLDMKSSKDHTSCLISQPGARSSYA